MSGSTVRMRPPFRGYDVDMSESTNEKDQHNPADTQFTGGGGNQPDADAASPAPPAQPRPGEGVDLKSADLGDA